MDAEGLRRKGNAVFTAKKFDEALALYTLVSTSIQVDTTDAGAWVEGLGLGLRM